MPMKAFLFLFILFLGTLGQVGADLILPSLPAMADDLQTTNSMVQLTIAYYFFGFIFSQLLFAPLSDGIGRRRPALVGLCLCVIGCLVCANTHNIYVMHAGRLLQGFGAGGAYSVSRPMMRDIFDDTQLRRYGSLFPIIAVFFLALAPVLGGYLQSHIGWQANFHALLTYAVVVFLVQIFFIPETNPEIDSSKIHFRALLHSFKRLLSDKAFLGYNAASMLAYGCITTWLTVGPILMQEGLGMTPIEFGHLCVLTGLGFGAGGIANSLLIDRSPMHVTIQIGFAIIALAGLSLLITGALHLLSWWIIMLPIICIFFATTLIFPNTSVGALMAFPGIAGAVSALIGALRMGSGSFFSAIAAVSHDRNQVPMAVIITASSLTAWFIFYFTVVRAKAAARAKS